MDSDSYPYHGLDGICGYAADKTVTKLTGAVEVDRTPDALKAALQIGPVNINLHASYSKFRQYKTGIFDDDECPTETNHAVLVVGWGKEEDKEYFIVRNSWNSDWGDQGHIKLAVTQNRLGICGMLFYAPMYPLI